MPDKTGTKGRGDVDGGEEERRRCGDPLLILGRDGLTFVAAAARH